LRRRPDDQRAARDRERRDPARRQAAPRMDSLRLDVTVPLRSFSLELALEVGAETVALVGPSGAGKSTVLRAIAGLVRPARGFVACGEERWADAPAGLHRPPEDRSVGLVFQEYALFP